MTILRRNAARIVVAAFLAACGSSGGTSDGSAMTGDDMPSDHDGSQPNMNVDGGVDGAQPAVGAPLVGGFVGVNAFPNTDITQLANAFGAVREYHDWQWCEGNGDSGYPGYPNNLNSYTLFPFDTFYSGLSAKGVSTNPAIQGGIPWINNGAVPPVASGADPTAAASYIAHGDQLYQYAARYGGAMVPDGKLKVVSGETRSTGLGYLHYYEDFNEQDAYWNNGGNPIMTAADFAAMASADYDGDQSRLGTTIGVKNADPNGKLVMGGLSGKGTGADWVKWITDYLDGMKTWAAAHRGGSFPADVLNVHHYCFSASSTGPASSPEDCNLKSTLAMVSAYRDANLPGHELWLSEFGYDTDSMSVLRAPAIGSNSQQIVQAQWIVRSYLAILAAGFDRAHLFVIADDACGSGNDNCHQQFATSGVVTATNTLKPSYYFIAAFRSRLATMRYAGEQTSGQAKVTIYKFQSSTDDSGAYVVWSPTADGSTTAAYSLQLAASATTAKKVVLADQSMMGNETTGTIAGGTVSVDVGETPTIVLVDHMH